MKLGILVVVMLALAVGMGLMLTDYMLARLSGKTFYRVNQQRQGGRYW